MNTFDLALALAAFGAIVLGYRSGLMRSAATILGYVCAAPLAVKATAFAGQAIATLSSAQAFLIFFAILLLGGEAMAAALRMAVNEIAGEEIGVPDRIAGSMLGAVRVALVAVTLVLVFDRMIPAGRDPAFLSGSHLRPILSMAAQKGLKSLPPETAAFIDQIKNRRQT